MRSLPVAALRQRMSDLQSPSKSIGAHGVVAHADATPNAAIAPSVRRSVVVFMTLPLPRSALNYGFTLPPVECALQEVHHEGSEIVRAVCGTAKFAKTRVRKCARVARRLSATSVDDRGARCAMQFD